ncbi:uncharacterized protein LOC116010810 [Ipomoea triloba]|uniref:uncharacterized protein LOC116010810 n=1 Tax=Ipomoea triloba TaxID=35885 RepID=UPI00125CDB82|nr:uncharacterized protein LOC116010810 [Ipomoea triloba]
MADLPRWRMTCYYGYPERSRRREAWDFLRSLADRSALPWVVIGDFNDLQYQHEKRGGNPHPNSLLRGFGEAMEDCELIQLPLRGYQYTWERGKGSEEWMEEKLDKVFATSGWCGQLEDACVENILTRTSDHSALFLSPLGEGGRGGGRRKGFKFEMAWLLDEGCMEVVQSAWQEGRPKGLLDCVQFCAALAEFRRVEDQLGRLEAQEDVFWRQRAKQHWLKGADANTKFYHRYASARRKKNHLHRLKNDAGVWVEGDAMKSVVLDYFENIFKSSGSSMLESFFTSVNPRVTQADNEHLLCPFEHEEVKAALFAMFPDKAPGPDGMNPGFYKHYWDVVGVDVSQFVIDCLNTCTFPIGLNDTNVVLIPKKCVPESVADLRPIALCNVIYKIMAKVLANRMKHLLGDLISESQSAFIPNRLITDNILVAAEVGHFFHRKQSGLVGWGALKLDMAKAYDRMEWPFLRGMLSALGFSDRWVNLIMLCVTTVSYSFLVNGVPNGHVVPTRGLRQGDPLSPYLFIICAEGLSLLLQQAQAAGTIHGCRVARGAPPVSHLLFADDSLLFFKANAQEARAVKQCLNRYEEMSGQVVNYHKSSVCFSINTMVEHREEVVAILGVAQTANFGKYLGLPTFVGRNRKAAFAYIEDKIRQRVNSWNKKLLSQARKEVLLKSVAQAMPTFSMSVFLLPESGIGRDRGIHWKAWDQLCVPRKFGGLGFKDLRAFNLTMLGKQEWRFLTMPQSLVARVYKARYFPTTSFLDATIGNNPSYCWRSIMAAHTLICSGVRRRIGNGRSTQIWGHPWLPDGPDPMVATPMPVYLIGSLVSGLIDEASGMWDLSVLDDIFVPGDVSRIVKIPISPTYEDSWYWYGDPKGIYTVKMGYRAIVGDFNGSTGAFNQWVSLWKIKVPPKWKTFLWRALSDILPVTTNLLLKRVEVDPTCPMCGQGHEDVMHALVMCDYSQLVWHVASLPTLSIVGDSFCMWFSDVLNSLTEQEIGFVMAVLYYIWWARNSAVWDGALPLPRKVVSMVSASLHAWRNTHAQTMAGSDHAGGATHTQPQRPTCFFDASLHPDTCKASFGAVLFSAQGEFTAACSGPLPDCFSPLMAEAAACKAALTWIRERGLMDVTILTDCAQLNTMLHSATVSFSYVGLMLDACKATISTFNSCFISFIPRS